MRSLGSTCASEQERALVAPMATTGRAEGDVHLAGIFGASMVLQRDCPIRLWGRAMPGQRVNIWLSEVHETTVVDGDGHWSITFPAMPAGGPHALTISGRETYCLDNILVGDVWLCAGQSNMQWTVSQAANGAEETAVADHPDVRLLQVKRETAPSATDEIDANWNQCSSEMAGDFSAVAYSFGRTLHNELAVPIGLIESSWGGTPIEPWMPNLPSSENAPGSLAHASDGQPGPGEIYNAMVAPLTLLPIRGIVWYQGEANVRRAETYGGLFKSLIQRWRRAWGNDNLPFGFVQIAPYEYRNLPDWKGTPQSLPRLREGQAEAARELPNVGMVVVADLSDVQDIHSVNKQEVGRRLALWALANVYSRDDISYSGPTYRCISIESGRIRVRFDHAESGLIAKDGKPLTWFQIAGDDQRFVIADAHIEGDSVVVQSSEAPEPVAARFAYEDVAVPNLFNAKGFPAAPFRTDDWPVKTVCGE